MPNVLIEVRRQFTRQEETGIINAVHSALQTAFKIPACDKTARLVVHEPHRFVVSSKLTRPDYYVLITIDAFAGRSVEAKRSLYQTIVKNLVAFDIPKDHITILIKEHTTENWGIRGGQAACDVDLGFKVDV